jgi:hypothetical protein
MHLSEGDLRSFCDGELSQAEIAQLQAHINICPLCRQRCEFLRARSSQVQSVLAALNPTLSEAATSTRTARIHLDSYSTMKENIPMIKKMFAPRVRLVWAALALITILAASLSLPPVRAFANSFLGLFRVQQVSVIPFDPLNLPSNFSANQTGITQLFADNLKIDKQGKAQDAANTAEASSLAGIPVRLPQSLSGTPRLSIQPGTKVSFKVDLPRIQAILSDAGFKDIQLPKELNGATVNAQLPMIVTAIYGDFHPGSAAPGKDPDNSNNWCSDCTVLVQLASPTIQTPEGVDLKAIGKAYLRLTGMTDAEAESFSQTVDWTTTLVIPVPNSTTHQTVSVDGVNGVFIQQSQDNSNQYMLIWVKDGIVYGLTGYGDSQTALNIANSLK